MTGRGKRKKIFLFVGILFLVFVSAAGVFLLWLRRKINDIEVLQNYRIQYTEATGDAADCLEQLCRDKLGLKMYRASDHSHLYLKLIADAQEAQSYGFSLEGMEEGGFCIARNGNTLYLLAKTQRGLHRACYYLVYSLTDENGHIMLALDERYFDRGTDVRREILIGDRSVGDYSIVQSGDVPAPHARDLVYYINQACGALPGIQQEECTPCIRLMTDVSLPAGTYNIEGTDGDITIRGADEASLAKGICQFANTYLGWMYAGTQKESMTGGSAAIHIPASIGEAETSWIEEREAIVTLWKINFDRGVFWNNATSLKNDIMSFSEEQLYEYVRMLKYCGYTGIQVTDMCSAWAGEGGYQYVHERIRMLADAAHSLDMKFTLWVWGAQFDDFGWVDSSVAYASKDGGPAWEDQDVLDTFEKYYSIYAQLADCCDRVIAHYVDPGMLATSEDVAYFAQMLADKFRDVNPDIDFGISCWVDHYNRETMIAQLGSNITLYESGHHENEEEYETFRGFCVAKGCRLGTWAWNTCEMEIDQLAQMNFNPHIIRSVYWTAMEYDNIKKPEYWSEMDSYHVLNVFSLYCAGQLLKDPSLEPEQLTYDVALAAVGEEYAEGFAGILKLIETARSGESWDTYWWQNENYILKSEAYPAEEILAESGKALELLQEMIDSGLEANTLPLPLELGEVLRLMLPHIQQIKAYAEFRIALSEAENMYSGGASPEELQEKIDSISAPIPEYNAVIGLWGQPEGRAQQELLEAFCREKSLEMPVDPAYDRERKFRIYSDLVRMQKGKQEPVCFQSPNYQYGLAYGQETTDRLIGEMIEEGILKTEDTTGAVYLADWEKYRFIFH